MENIKRLHPIDLTVNEGKYSARLIVYGVDMDKVKTDLVPLYADVMTKFKSKTVETKAFAQVAFYNAVSRVIIWKTDGRDFTTTNERIATQIDFYANV